MNIAVIFTKDKREGGAFQHSVSLSLLLRNNSSDKYNFIFFTTVRENTKVFEKYNLKFHYLRWSNIDRFFNIIYGSRLLNGISAKLKINLWSRIDRALKRRGIDLVYFINSSDMALAMNRFNYIFTIWDLCFLEHPEFPEVYMHRDIERRDGLCRSALCKAVKVITDSEFTKINIVQRYNIDKEKILPLPLLPSRAVNISKKDYDDHYIDIKHKYGINGKYIFYPAQFWQHKNHIYILEGLKILKEKFSLRINAVFSGSDKGNLGFVLDKAREFGISDQVFYIGFVDDVEMPYLYKQALALVMPSYLGPTNIPPLEAFKLGCPVLYPDLPGSNEQVRDAVLLLDLKNPESLCNGLLKIVGHPEEAGILIDNGRKKIEALEKEDRWAALKDIFDNYNQKMKCWK